MNNDEYAHDVLVEPTWVEERLDQFQADDPSLRIVEVDLNTEFYEQAHIPGAVGFDWRTQLQHNQRRDVPSKAQFADLLESHGISDESTIVMYGDNANWFASHFYWVMSYYGYDDMYLLNGGRELWLEQNRPTTTETPSFPRESFIPKGPFENIRAYREDVKRALDSEITLLDVRLPEEYSGKIVTPPGMNETARRGGHIPGAINILWSENLNPDGRFKSRERLEQLYHEHGITEEKYIIVYCRIGERSSFAWFVLSELLGFPAVENYDGSWTEWGNLIGVPIGKGISHGP